ncbi:MAG TPA: hypothetical protein VF678_06975 [bacterium]
MKTMLCACGNTFKVRPGDSFTSTCGQCGRKLGKELIAAANLVSERTRSLEGAFARLERAKTAARDVGVNPEAYLAGYTLMRVAGLLAAAVMPAVLPLRRVVEQLVRDAEEPNPRVFQEIPASELPRAMNRVLRRGGR